MKMAMIGLGKMGANMATRLLRSNIEVVGYDQNADVVNELKQQESLIPATGVDDALSQLSSPRIVWSMLPSGDPTEQLVTHLIDQLQPGDIIIEGGNSNYHDSLRRAELANTAQVQYIDVGTSGGVWGLDNGYCLMAGGNPEAIEVITPILQALAPDEVNGWAHVGPSGAGHFTKMIHNGIEYGMMQAFAEGFALMKGKTEFDLDMAQIAELWRHGSVVRSWLLDLSADFLNKDQEFEDIAPIVADSGEGRWTVNESIDQGIATPVLTLALHMRFASQDNRGYGNRMLSMMRNAFGGHFVNKK